MGDMMEASLLLELMICVLVEDDSYQISIPSDLFQYRSSAVPNQTNIVEAAPSGYFEYVKSTKSVQNTGRYASLTFRPGQARPFQKAWNNGN